MRHRAEGTLRPRLVRISDGIPTALVDGGGLRCTMVREPLC